MVGNLPIEPDAGKFLLLLSDIRLGRILVSSAHSSWEVEMNNLRAATGDHSSEDAVANIRTDKSSRLNNLRGIGSAPAGLPDAWGVSGTPLSEANGSHVALIGSAM